MHIKKLMLFKCQQLKLLAALFLDVKPELYVIKYLPNSIGQALTRF
jgi:hypothetical protein